MSAHLAIQSAIVAALTAAPALSNVRANSTRPMPTAQSQSVVVRLLRSRANTPTLIGGPYDWTTDFQIECLARASGATAEPAAAVDTLLSAVWERLAGMTPGSLAVLDVRMSPDIDWQYDDADAPMAAAIITLRVVHRTGSTSLTAWS